MRRIFNRLICLVRGHDYTEMEWTGYGGGLDEVDDCYCKRCGKRKEVWIYYDEDSK